MLSVKESNTFFSEIKVNQKNVDEFNKSRHEDQIFRENQIFNDFLMNNSSYNGYNEQDTINKVKKEINSSDNPKVEVKIINNSQKNINNVNNNPQKNIKNVNNSSNKIANKKPADRYWWAFKKDWELISSANQIRCINNTAVKKIKNLHSSKLTKDEKRIFHKGKKFKLEPEQDNSGYYKIKI